MKKIILGLALVATFAACKSNKSESEKTNVVLLQDTFRMYNSSIQTDKNQNGQTYAAPLGAAIGTERNPPATKKRSHSNNNDINKTTGSGTTAQAPASVPAKKKGWSNRAKGAAIGAGTGAAAGAIINGRNRGAGAAIGAVIGAAGGYIIGNEMDRKKGRN